MDDLISRQAAIDDLHGKDPSQVWDTADVEVWLNELPTGQPDLDTRLYTDGFVDGYKQAQMDAQEIIRCKDCKYAWLTDEGEYYPEDMVCSYWDSDGLNENDFCSYAERRTDDSISN